MRVVTDTEKITGSYRLKLQIESDIEKTKMQGSKDQKFIPAVVECILIELSKQLETVERQIQEKWDEAERAGEEVAIQGAFKFYWECDIAEGEIPF